MFAIITVTGADSTGIIAAVTTALAEEGVNIVDVSQTLMSGYFTMILRVEFSAPISQIQRKLSEVADSTGQSIRIQSEELFTAMNEI